VNAAETVRRQCLVRTLLADFFRSLLDIFTVFALKVDQLPLKKEASGAMVGYYLNQNAIGKASFTGTYGR
jgi:hypothetical protein